MRESLSQHRVGSYRFLDFTTIPEPLNSLPVNHLELWHYMVDRAQETPSIEVAGFLLTNIQGRGFRQVGKFTGDEREVDITPLPHSVLDSFPDWDTYVVYHSHPVGFSVEWSSPDKSYQEKFIEEYLTGLLEYRRASGRLHPGFLNYYNYVVLASGEFKWRGGRFEIKLSKTFPSLERGDDTV